MEHVSTVEVARDLDLMRQLVGDKKLNFFGASYGTYIGATYAGLFPKKVGRMVLDGAVDPLADPHKVAVHQTAGFQTALDAYLQDCVDKGSCPLGDSVAEGEQRLIDFFKSLDQSPLPTSSGRDLTEGLGFLGVIFPLYSKELWPYLTQAMQQAFAGSGDTLLALADFYNHRKADGTYTGNSTEANPAVNCLDHPQDVSVQQIEANEQEFLKASNVFGQVGMWFDYGCSNWPVSSTEKQARLLREGCAADRRRRHDARPGDALRAGGQARRRARLRRAAQPRRRRPHGRTAPATRASTTPSTGSSSPARRRPTASSASGRSRTLATPGDRCAQWTHEQRRGRP